MLRQSRLSHVAKIKTPLLITQGATIRESTNANPIRSWSRCAREVIAAAERFLAKHLGGRYQSTMTPEVAERLKVLTVDVKDLSVVTKPKQP